MNSLPLSERISRGLATPNSSPRNALISRAPMLGNVPGSGGHERPRGVSALALGPLAGRLGAPWWHPVALQAPQALDPLAVDHPPLGNGARRPWSPHQGGATRRFGAGRPGHLEAGEAGGRDLAAPVPNGPEVRPEPKASGLGAEPCI